MAQTTVLAAGTTAATSSDIVVAAGATVTVGLYTADAGGIPGNVGVSLYIDTPGSDRLLAKISGNDGPQVVSGPCTLRAVRGVVGTSIGVYTES